MTTIALGTDHAGFHLKEIVKRYLADQGHEVLDFGTNSETPPVDYPQFVKPAAQAVAEGRADLAVVFGGSGNGEAIAANKVRGIRCALCWDEWSAQMAKRHNDANVIAIGGRVVSESLALRIVTAWLESSFEAGRHLRRIEMLED